MTGLFRDSDWLATGRHGGRLIQSAQAILSTIGSDIPLCFDVLDSVYGDERLATTLASKTLLDDVRYGRIGGEWDEERHAYAEYSAEQFAEEWPNTRTHMREAQLVSLVSAIENYVKTLVVEFPPHIGTAEVDTTTEMAPERAWQVADDAYRLAVKRVKGSTGAAWVALCEQSSMPAEVKLAVRDWAIDRHLDAIEEMILLRNAIVHNAGVASVRLAECLQISPGTKAAVTPELTARYGRAYRSFVVAIDAAI